jgi:hypothetical protein
MGRSGKLEKIVETIANTVEALTFDDKTAAYDQGGRYARSKLETLTIAEDAARTLGTDCSFDRWEAYRIQWVDGHTHANPRLTGNAHDAAWAEFAKLLGTLYGLEKPKSVSAAAVKKAAEREKAAEALLAKYEGTPAVELRDQLAKTYEAMARNPENKDLKKAQRELDKVLKLKTSTENKQHGEELRRLRAEVREMVGKCTDIEKLEAALEVLDPDTDLEYRIAD